MRRIWRKGLPLLAGLALAAPVNASDPGNNGGSPFSAMENESEDVYTAGAKKTTKKPAAKKKTTKPPVKKTRAK